jgi:hypothetical protein
VGDFQSLEQKFGRAFAQKAFERGQIYRDAEEAAWDAVVFYRSETRTLLDRFRMWHSQPDLFESPLAYKAANENCPFHADLKTALMQYRTALQQLIEVSSDRCRQAGAGPQKVANVEDTLNDFDLQAYLEERYGPAFAQGIIDRVC